MTAIIATTHLEHTTMTATIATRLVHFTFDLDVPAHAEQWAALQANELAAIPFKMWTIWAGRNAPRATANDLASARKYSDKLCALVGRSQNKLPSQNETIHTVTVKLETQHLFADQWNAEGLRLHNKAVFEWASEKIVQGYYLEQTQEMREILANTCQCGYCGHKAPKMAGVQFCDKCLSSPYLKECDLHLLRMLPIASKAKRNELTAAQRDVLLPAFQDAQTKLQSAKAIEQRKTLTDEHAKAIEKADMRFKGMCALLDGGFNIENVIFYDHKKTFCFGWRDGLDAATITVFRDKLQKIAFPYAVEFKTA